METKSLTELLGSTANTELFSGTRFQPAKPIPAAPVEPKQPREKKSQKKAAEGETEEDRMIFVGNVDLACKKNKVKKLLEKYGPVEKVWRRSIPLDRGKLPITAAVALGMVTFYLVQRRSRFLQLLRIV